jgi:hypothetical protein
MYKFAVFLFIFTLFKGSFSGGRRGTERSSVWRFLGRRGGGFSGKRAGWGGRGTAIVERKEVVFGKRPFFGRGGL